MGNGTWAAGILGAIGGAAQGGMVAAKYEMDEEAERRRLYAQEMKERRMAEFGLDIKRQSDIDDVYGMVGATNEEEYNAFFEKNTALKPWKTDPTGLSNVLSSDYSSTREVQERTARDAVELEIQKEQEQRAEARRIAQEQRALDEPQQYPPGSIVTTPREMGKKIQAAPDKTIQNPITYSPAQQTQAVKNAIEQAKNSLTGGTNPFGATQEKILQESALTDFTEDPAAASAYQAMLTDMSVSRVAARLNARAAANPQYGVDIDGATAAAEMKAEQALIDKAINQASGRYNVALGAVEGLTTRALEAKANEILDTGQGVTAPDGRPFNPRVTMEKAELWTPTIRSLIKQTMINHYIMIRRNPQAARPQPVIAPSPYSNQG